MLEHHRLVRALSRKLTSDPWLAADIEQQAWVVALERPPGHDGALQGWFARVLKSCLANTLVSQRGRIRREFEAVRDREDRELEGTGPEHLHEDVRDALDSLPALYSEVLRLRYLEGLSTHQIAEHLAIPANTVRSRLQRGIASMGERLDRRWRGERNVRSLLLLPWKLVESPPSTVGDVDLLGGQVTDLVVSGPEPLGQLDLSVVGDDRLPRIPRQVDLMNLADPLVTMEASRSHSTEWLSIDAQGRVRGRIPAGDDVLIVRGERAVNPSHRITVAPGATTRTEIVLQREASGVRQAVQFDLPASVAGRARVIWFEFRTPQGELVLEDMWTRLAADIQEFAAFPKIPTEDLVLRARIVSSDAATLSEKFEIPADRDRSIPITLRFPGN